ncbi:MAG TPA: SDR family oxidoreductase [Gemmatimonadaceae bacterium]|nr:SDR family oxidoreductase [Gemmatimonadaceae bacterium]
MDLRGRVALVTGGGIRVGRALAIALGEQGATVAIHYSSSERGAHETRETIRAAGGTADCFRADLTVADASPALVREVVARFGVLDILVNSAAIMVRTPFGDVDATSWDQMFALNLRAPFLLAQAAAPHLRQVQGGCIINISDLAAFETWPGYVPHGLTKAGVVYLTRALARILAPEVRVNAIAPGTVLLPEDFDANAAEHLQQTTPLQRQGNPQDVVQAMLYLLSAEYVTGETIVVDGGRHIRR